MSKILTGMLVLFFGFEIWPNPIFLGFVKFTLFFGSSNFCITHLNSLNEEHTALKNKIIVAFHIY